jgi:hypothetical protein
VDRKHAVIAGGAVAGAVFAVFIAIQRKHVADRTTPDWGDPEQPAVGTGGQLSGMPVPPSPDPTSAWGAVRPGSPRLNAGSRIMRTYPATLVDDPESLVR